MDIIELKQHSAQEAYTELKQRLECIGLLPDNYFSLASDWQDRRQKIPEDADITCTVDYDGNEGVYIGILLKWQENGRSVTRPFIIGKTLADTGDALDRMYLTASAVTKAFHGDRGQYARQTVSSQKARDNALLMLSPKERRIFVDALLDRREMLVGEMDGTEQLLRRMVGNIIEYVDLAGAKPLRLSDFDKAMLAIRDGEVETFKELYPKLEDHADELLIETAGRAGKAGRKMMDALLISVKKFSSEAYLAANKKAAEIGDLDRTKYLMENMLDRARNPHASYYGEVILHAWRQDRGLARELVDWCPQVWIASASTDLLYYLSSMPATGQSLAEALVKKGAPCGNRAWEILNRYISSGSAAGAACLIRDGMRIAMDDYDAFDVCVKGKAVECAKLLIQGGFDFAGYLEWEPTHSLDRADEKTIHSLTEYWRTLHPQEQTAAPEEAQTQGQTFGGLSQ